MEQKKKEEINAVKSVHLLKYCPIYTFIKVEPHSTMKVIYYKRFLGMFMFTSSVLVNEKLQNKFKKKNNFHPQTVFIYV